MTASVKDITDFEALPEEVKELARKYYQNKLDEAEAMLDAAYKNGREEAYDEAYDEGYAQGDEDGYKRGYQDGQDVGDDSM